MQGNVPLTARFLIAVTAEHIILAIIFVINAAVPPDHGHASHTAHRCPKEGFALKRGTALSAHYIH